MRLSDLQNKDLVNLIDGKKIGRIIDVSIDLDGNVNSLIADNTGFLTWMGNKKEIEIKWSQITKIGSDVILVEIVI
jgi:YlmC/YmxH family sporulation protein